MSNDWTIEAVLEGWIADRTKPSRRKLAFLKQMHDLPKHFLVMNGDILTDLNFKQFFEDHVNKNSLFTICSKLRKQKIDYGVLESNSEGNLASFIEKPENEYLVSMGIYMASIDINEYIPDGYYGFDKLMLELLKRGKKVNLNKFNGYWLDIGKPDDYIKAIDDFDSMKENLL